MLPVVYTTIAEKYFKKLKDKQLINAYKDAIMSIRESPDIGVAKTGDLKVLISTITEQITNWLIKFHNLKMAIWLLSLWPVQEKTFIRN